MADNSKHYEAVGKFVKKVDTELVDKLAKTYRLVLSKRDTQLVACGQPKELETIKKNFLIKKLKLDISEKRMDNALAYVCEQMGKSNPRKSRLVFYYLLIKRLKVSF